MGSVLSILVDSPVFVVAVSRKSWYLLHGVIFAVIGFCLTSVRTKKEKQHFSLNIVLFCHLFASEITKGDSMYWSESTYALDSALGSLTLFWNDVIRVWWAVVSLPNTLQNGTFIIRMIPLLHPTLSPLCFCLLCEICDITLDIMYENFIFYHWVSFFF